MFNRRESQKPSDELYKHFKASFPGLNHDATGTSDATAGAPSLADALDIPVNARHVETLPHDAKDVDHAHHGHNDAWTFGTSGLTPSIMDPNSQSFSMFANQIPGYYTPTSAGTGTVNHTLAGDLHTPGYAMGLGTPLSVSEGGLHAGHQALTLSGYHSHLPQHMQQQSFQNVNPFHMHHQTSFAPHQFTNQPAFEGLDGGVGESPVDDIHMDMNMHQQDHSPQMLFHSHALQKTMQPPPLHSSGEKFRYHVTLNAQTAMVKHADEIPVTYLNKGQAYTLNVVDTQPKKQHARPVWYRTFVRVSFEEDEQREKPSSCWQLWKEGRGTNEAHQRGGLLQAVEYVESGQSGGPEDPSKPKIEVLSSSFDGFCVRWSPSAGTVECPISVRFNFLSTDFSHSKGVKGIPVRLCAKTELIGENSNSSSSTGAEVCYCKVKLFRDHGAERKLSNDTQHVRKIIEKIQVQIGQIESGVKDFGKRKRSGSMAKVTGLDHRPGKVPKHRRTWSMSSVTSNSGRGSAEEDLHVKLETHIDMLKSARPASVLNLRGDDVDDPDLHPVKISLEPLDLQRMDSADTAAWEGNSSQNGPSSSSVSPTPSSKSLSVSRRDSNIIQHPTPLPSVSRENSNDDPSLSHLQTAIAKIEATPPTIVPHLASPPEAPPVKFQTRSPNSGTPSGWLEAQDVDPNYNPPPERAVKPVACFYIQPRVAGRAPGHNYYSAIYLFRRTLEDFVNAAALKSIIQPTQVVRIVRVNRNGLQILYDDECIRALPDGQDMKAEFNEIQLETSTPTRPTREWNASPDAQGDAELSTPQNTTSTAYELRLLF